MIVKPPPPPKETNPTHGKVNQQETHTNSLIVAEIHTVTHYKEKANSVTVQFSDVIIINYPFHYFYCIRFIMSTHP
jgi:hypothetical protein